MTRLFRFAPGARTQESIIEAFKALLEGKDEITVDGQRIMVATAPSTGNPYFSFRSTLPVSVLVSAGRHPEVMNVTFSLHEFRTPPPDQLEEWWDTPSFRGQIKYGEGGQVRLYFFDHEDKPVARTLLEKAELASERYGISPGDFLTEEEVYKIRVAAGQALNESPIADAIRNLPNDYRPGGNSVSSSQRQVQDRPQADPTMEFDVSAILRDVLNKNLSGSRVEGEG